MRTATVFPAMRLAALVLSCFLAAPAQAQELAPDELVRKVTADVLDAIKSDTQLQAGDRKKARWPSRRSFRTSISPNPPGSRWARRGAARRRSSRSRSSANSA